VKSGELFADTPKSEAPSAEPTTETEPVSKDPDPVEPPKADAEDSTLDEPDDFDVNEIDPKFTKIRARVEKQQAKLREARQEAQFGRMVQSVAKAGGLDPNAAAWWIQKGAAANAGDPMAQAELAEFFDKSGWRPKNAPAPEPVRQEAPKVDLKAQSEEIYKAHFAEKVKKLQMDEDVAREAADAWAASVAPKPAHSQPTPVPQPVQQTQLPQQSNTRTEADIIKSAVFAEMDRLDAAYKRALGDEKFKLVQQEATRLVEEDRKAGRLNQNPATWYADWQAKLKIAQTSLNKTAAPAKPKIDSGIRPSNGKAPVATSTETWAQRKERLAQAMRNGEEIPID
jgi:hypothetical protein